MRKCRFCEKEISDASRVCEHCGKDLVAVPATPPAAREPHGLALLIPDPDLLTAPIARVTVVDIDMPASSMTWFMVKWTLASIPAFLILFLIFLVSGFLFGGMFSACKIPGMPR